MNAKSLTQLRVVPTRIPRVEPNETADVDVYKSFFTAGVIAVLTAGCLLGALALFGIARAASYTATAWTPAVLAHANSQLYGWVGFFIMGFALQHHPPTNARKRLFHGLSYGALGLMAIGIVARFFAEPLVRTDHSFGLALGLGSTIVQAGAILLFMGATTLTRQRTVSDMGWATTFVLSSLACFVALAIIEPIVFLRAHDAVPQNAILFIAEWMVPIRDLQFLGFVSLMIFGVSCTKFASCFYFESANKRLALTGFVFWITGLTLRMFGWNSAYQAGLAPNAMGTYFVGGALLAIGAIVVASGVRVFGHTSARLPAHKFMQASYAWLMIAGALMILEPIHLRSVGQPFSHAYLGAIRHAVTVGFISQMIVGVGSRVAAKMNGLDPAKLSQLCPTFVLLNLGNLARVALEISTDYTKAAFMPMGLTGFVELTALVLWAGTMAVSMFPKFRRKVSAYA